MKFKTTNIRPVYQLLLKFQSIFNVILGKTGRNTLHA